MRNGGQLLVESLCALGARKAFGVPEELTRRQTLSQMRAAALAAKDMP